MDLKSMKRKRGGQPGNQNGRKHGFFSSHLEPEEIQEFWDIIKKERVAPEVALIRVKLVSSLRRDPGNRLVLNEAAKLTAKLTTAQHGFNRSKSRKIKKALLDFWEYCADPSRSQPADMDEWLQKDESSVL